MREFLNNEARQYPALEIEYIPGHNPELRFLNKFKRVVSTHDISPLNGQAIQELLQSRGIHIWTVTPTYVPPEFQPTAHCKAWRQTANCDPDGQREALADESCFATIESGRSGFCECIGRDNAAFVCEHTPLTCEAMCTEKVESEEETATTGTEAADEF